MSRRRLLALVVLGNPDTDLGRPAALLLNDLGDRAPEPNPVADLPVKQEDIFTENSYRAAEARLKAFFLDRGYGWTEVKRTAELILDLRAAHLQLSLHQDEHHALRADGSLPVSLNWTEGFQAAVLGDVDVGIHSDGLSLAFLNAFSGGAADDIASTLWLDLRATGPTDRPLLGGKQGQEVAIDYEMTPDLDLRTSANSRGSSSVDIIWRKRY